MDTLTSPLSKVDPRLVFSNALTSFSKKSAQELKQLIDSLEPNHKKFVVELYQIQSVQLSGD